MFHSHKEEFPLSFLSQLGSVFDYQAALVLVIRALAALLCLTVHETCHGVAAWYLGDPTARNYGRLSLNPLRHLDPWGFLLLMVAGFGWAKPVPVNPGYFRNPKRGMALTALAGPVSNFLLALVSAGVLSLLYHLGVGATEPGFWLLAFFGVLVWLNLGLGIFNLFPIPPLDGAKVFFSFLPNWLYQKMLQYERYIMLVLFALVFFNVLNGPMGFLMNLLANGLCQLTALPLEVLAILLNAIYI